MLALSKMASKVITGGTQAQTAIIVPYVGTITKVRAHPFLYR
jgi:hypothetical protein